MKKKCTLKVGKTALSKNDLPTTFLSIGGQILRTGVKFEIVEIRVMPPIRKEGNPYAAVIVELETGLQVPLSKNFFDGRYYASELNENGEIVTEIKTIDTVFSDSGLDIWDFCANNLDTVFVIGDPIEYETQPFDSNGQRLSVLTKRKFNTYSILPKESETPKE